MVFELKAEGNRVTGMAHMSNWPGDAPLTFGWVDGDRVRFTVVGRQPSWGFMGGALVGIGYPKLEFTGTIHGRDMQLTLVWSSVQVIGKDDADGHVLPMEAKKTAD